MKYNQAISGIRNKINEIPIIPVFLREFLTTNIGGVFKEIEGDES